MGRVDPVFIYHCPHERICFVQSGAGTAEYSGYFSGRPHFGAIRVCVFRNGTEGGCAGETIVFAIQILLELALGFVLGMVMNFFFYIVQLAGLTVDTQMGMTMNQIYDAGAQGNLSVTGEILNVLMTLLFFAANGHHTLLRMMAASGQIVGFGSVAISPDVAGAALELFVECTVLAVKLCMPILAAELLGQVGMGILMKAIPQINVFSINIELKVLIGLVLLLLLISPFSEFLLQTEITMLDSLRELLAMTG